MEKVIEEVLEKINEKKPKFPDNSGRTLKLKLGRPSELEGRIVLLNKDKNTS